MEYDYAWLLRTFSHWQTGQHPPSGMVSFSPHSSQGGGAGHLIKAHGSMGTHWGQHSPWGTWRLSKKKTQVGGSGHLTVEQSWAWHSGQHWPSGITRISPGLQSFSGGHCRSLQGSRSQPPGVSPPPPPWIAAPGRKKAVMHPAYWSF